MTSASKLVVYWQSHRFWLAGCAAFFLLSSAGCVKAHAIEGGMRFAYEWWAGLSVLALGVVAAPAGYAIAKVWSYGWALAIGGPQIALFVGPSMFLEEAKFANDKLEMRTGFWAMTNHTCDLAETTHITLTSKTTRGRRGRKNTNYYMNCTQRSGGTIEFPVNNDIQVEAAKLFLDEAIERDIPIVNNISD